MTNKLIATFILLFTFFFNCSAHADMAFVNRPDVQAFINQMVNKYKFKKADLVQVFDKVKVQPAVIQQIKSPLEKKPWYIYQTLFITEWRIRNGVEFWKKHQDTLARAEKIYGVPASIIIATLGVETKYGKNAGEYPVIQALSSIAFSASPRANYFRNELKEFLLLTREQRMDPLKVMGSYAGAIGQPQFMPSSYRAYAVDFSGNGKIDLIHNEEDVIGSVANYYHLHGWKPNQPVATAASLNRPNLNDKNIKVMPLDGRYRKEYWVTYPNFEVIKRYNPSNLYAMVVYQLSTYITDLKKRLS